MRNEQEVVENFIKQHNLAVVTTVSQDFLPEAAVVGISALDNLELLFGTFHTSRKWQNLQKNSRVALVIGWDQGRTVQYEGEATELSENERADAMTTHLAQVPSLAKFMAKGEMAIFKVTPKWVRYSDNSIEPVDLIELTF